jgi:hypothetical protein
VESIGIGSLAKRAGVGIDTVRYYERNRLLTPSTRLASGIPAACSCQILPKTLGLSHDHHEYLLA